MCSRERKRETTVMFGWGHPHTVTNELELGGGGLLLLQNHVWKVGVSMGGTLPQRYLATRRIKYLGLHRLEFCNFVLRAPAVV